jgi:hypothetical protein
MVWENQKIDKINIKRKLFSAFMLLQIKWFSLGRISIFWVAGYVVGGDILNGFDWVRYFYLVSH